MCILSLKYKELENTAHPNAICDEHSAAVATAWTISDHMNKGYCQAYSLTCHYLHGDLSSIVVKSRYIGGKHKCTTMRDSK